ncbi:hypothetical protein ACQKP3_22600 [Vibrio sp. DNB22_10_4]
MPYELKDFENNEISFAELNNKSFACAQGENQESLFVKTFKKLQDNGFIQSEERIAIHPEKEANPYHPDLIVNEKLVAELKTKASPLFMAQNYGIDPQYALTMDLKDSLHYNKLLEQGTDVTIYVWVKWAAKTMQRYSVQNGQKCYNDEVFEVGQLAGIWKVNFSQLRQFERDYQVPIHWYKEEFRKPPEYSRDEPEHKAWYDYLENFEPRLVNPTTNKLKNITSKGYDKDTLYTKGDSSGSYVFDLRNPMFQRLYWNHKSPKRLCLDIQHYR